MTFLGTQGLSAARAMSEGGQGVKGRLENQPSPHHPVNDIQSRKDLREGQPRAQELSKHQWKLKIEGRHVGSTNISRKKACGVN